MADLLQVGAQTGTGPGLASDKDSATNLYYPLEKLVFGPPETYTFVSLSNGLPIQPATGVTWVLGASSASIGAVTANPPATDLSAFVEGTGKLMPVGGVCNETLSGDAGEDVLSVIRITPKRAVHVNLRNQSGAEIGTAVIPVAVWDGGGSLTVDGTVTVNGTATVNGTVTASNATGNVAAAAADSGNPVKVGGRARTSDVAALGNDNRADFVTDVNGKQIVLPYALPQNFVSGATGAIIDTTSTQVLAAAGSGLRNYVTSIGVYNSHATVSTFVQILDGASVLWEGYALAAGGGWTIPLPTPLKGSANIAINAKCGTTGAYVKVSMSGYVAP